MSELLIVSASGVALAGVVAASFAAGRPENGLPSAGWLFLAVLPFAMLRDAFPPQAAALQAQGLAAVGFCLALADALALRLVRSALPPLPRGLPRTPAATDPAQRRLLACLAAFAVIIPLIHLALSGHVPILDRILDTAATDVELARSREQFSKTLAVPGFLKILFQWTISVVGPALVLTLAFLGRLRWAAATFVWILLYATLSLARFPAVICVALCGVGLLFRLPPRGKTLAFGLILAVLAGWLALAQVRAGALLAWQAGQAQPAGAEIPVSPGDVERLGTPPASFSKLADILLYRSVLTPMEVSNRWYLYFSKDRGQAAKPLENLLPWLRRPGWRHPANVVGVWAYTSRFPGKYLDSVSAYASADADAFGQIGLLGPLLAGLALALARLAGAFLYVDDPIGNLLYACGVGQLVLFPFQASVQAILIPQGLAALLLLQAAWKRAAR